MSAVSSAADPWVDDLEDLLGLDRIRPDPVIDDKRRRKRGLASFGTICVAVAAVGLTAFLGELNRRSSSIDDVQGSVELPRSTGRNLAVQPPLPLRAAQASDTIGSEASPDLEHGLADSGTSTPRNLDNRAALARMENRERSITSLSSQPDVQAIGSEPALPGGGERSQLLRAEREGMIPADADTLTPAPKYVLDETPVAASSSRPELPRTPGSSQNQSGDETFAGKAGVTRRLDASRKMPNRETEAIDALRLLRRQ